MLLLFVLQADRGQLQQGTMEWTDEAVSGGIVPPPPFEST